MLNNYFNPQGMDPGVGWKPSGALGGMLYADREAKYQDAVSLQDAMARISTQMEQEKLNTYRADEGVRSAERPAKISGFGVDTALNNQRLGSPDFAPAMVRGQIGEAGTKEAKGKFDLGTSQSNIDSTNLSNVLKGMEAAGRQLEMYNASNPMMGELEYKAFLEKVPAGVRRMFPDSYGPGVNEAIKRISSAITNSPEHRREMEKVNAQADTAENNNLTTNWTNWIIANLKSGTEIEIAQAKAIIAQNKENFQQYLTRYMRKRAAGQPVSEEETRTAKGIEQMLYTLRSAAPGQIDPNAVTQRLLPDLDIQPRPVPGSNIPEPTNNVPPGAKVPLAEPGWNDEKAARLEALRKKRSSGQLR